jgi:hypothetical protein
MQYIFVLAIIALVFFLISKRRKQSLSTFDEYKENNPELVSNGKISCSSCGGRDIFVRNVGTTLTKISNIHMCRSCGKSLYRSETEI